MAALLRSCPKGEIGVPTLPPTIDTHLHFWDLKRFRYPWLDSEDCAPIRTNYLPGHFMADCDGLNVRGAVHVQADIDRSVDPVEETRWLASVLSEAHDLPPMVCVGYADLRALDLDDVLRRHAEFKCVRGIRQEAWFDSEATLPGVLQTNLLSDPAWVAGLRKVSRSDLSFELLVKPEQLAQAADIFHALPELPVILEHTGVPVIANGALPLNWRSGMRQFAKRVPQSVLKISAMGFIRSSWEVTDILPIVRESIEIFGPARCMFGSNFPVERPSGSYLRLWRAYDYITSDLSADDRSSLFSDTAQRVYGL